MYSYSAERSVLCTGRGQRKYTPPRWLTRGPDSSPSMSNVRSGSPVFLPCYSPRLSRETLAARALPRRSRDEALLFSTRTHEFCTTLDLCYTAATLVTPELRIIAYFRRAVLHERPRPRAIHAFFMTCFLPSRPLRFLLDPRHAIRDPM